MKSLITSLEPPGSKPVMQLCAPATGEIMPLHHLTNPLCKAGMLGDGVAICITRGEIIAPVNCVVEHIDFAKAQLRLVSSNGLKMLIQIGEPGVIEYAERLQFLVKVRQKCVAGTVLLNCDPLWIKQSGALPVCIFTLLNTAKLTAIKLSASNTIRAGDEPLFTLYV